MRDFSKIYKEDLDIVGKKAVELGELTRLRIPIPDGFVITTSFFKKFLDQTGISEEILKVEKINHPAISESIEKLFDPIKKKIMHTHLPENLGLDFHKFYKKLAGPFKDQSLNIFSSSPKNNKSVVFKNVKGDANLILKIKEIWTMHINEPIAIVVAKNMSSKTKGTIITDNPPKEVGDIAKKIQKHFYFPKVLDYVSKKGKIYVTAVRPFTGRIKKSPSQAWQNKKIKKVLIKGISINPGIVTGPVKILGNNSRVQIKNGEIIILSHFNKSSPVLKAAKAIIIDDDLPNSYSRMLYREDIKVPTIIRARNAAKILQNGDIITVNGVTGEIYRGSLV